MKQVLTGLLLCAVVPVFAQRVIDVNQKTNETPNRNLLYVVGGQPFSLAKYTKVVEGTPYLSENWMRGTVIVNSGSQYDNQLLRLDLIENELHYLDSAGREMIATEPVVEVLLTDSLTGKRYRFVHSSAIAVTEKPARGWYELLTTGTTAGTANLFRQFHKEIVETRPYGSATYEESIKTSSYFFVAYNNAFTPVKRVKDLPTILGAKKTELNNFISSRELSGKSESDFISVVEYFNSLVK
jgi:hypothetical protein